MAVLAMAMLGIYSYQKLPIDAVPDITNVQVQINTRATGLFADWRRSSVSPFPPSRSIMAGLPNLQYTRSLSRYGLSQVTVIFEEGTDIYLRASIGEPADSGSERQAASRCCTYDGTDLYRLGEIFMWTVDAKESAQKAGWHGPITPTDLREIQDWIIRPQLRMVPGVTEVNCDRRLRQAIPRHALSRKADLFRVDLTRCGHAPWSATISLSAPAISKKAANRTWCGCLDR